MSSGRKPSGRGTNGGRGRNSNSNNRRNNGGRGGTMSSTGNNADEVSTSHNHYAITCQRVLWNVNTP